MNRNIKKDPDVSYRVTSKPSDVEITMGYIFDMMYSSFAMQVIQRYILPMSQINLYKKYENRKLNISLQKRTFISYDDHINDAFLHSELAAFVLLQRKHGGKNPFLPTKITDLEFVREVLKFYFLHTTDVINKQISEKEAASLAKKTLSDLQLSDLLSALYKHHIPPLMCKEGEKGYKVTSLQSSHSLDVDNAKGGTHQEKATVVKIDQRDTPLGRVGFDEMMVGFRMVHTDNVIFMKFQYSILDSEYKALKTRFLPQKNVDQEEAIFLLLTLYSGFGLLYRTPFARGLLDIADPKLKKLQERSTILLGTPFNVSKNQSYFSLFPEVEKYFGSIGSFFEAQPLTGTYSLLPVPSFVFMTYCLDRVEAWLNDAQKDGRSLTILFWYPHLYPTLYVDVDLPEFESNNNTTQDMIYDLVNQNLLPRLHAVKHKKEIFNYAPKRKLEANAKSYVFKVFVFQT